MYLIENGYISEFVCVREGWGRELEVVEVQDRGSDAG